MPKRVLDGEGLWRSDKLSRVKPEWMRAEYANLLPLSLANGVFEAEPRRIWSLVYSYNRPEITIEDVDQILAEFDRVGMLFRWNDEGTGKTWCFWTGIDKVGRLPSPSRLNKKHEVIGPTPPPKDLKKYVDSRASSQWLANGEVGFGFGFGSCTGSGSEASASHSPERSAPGVCDEAIAIWNEASGTLPKVRELTNDRRKKILKRLKENPKFLELLRQATAKAAVTPFLCGAGQRGWTATFDWLIKNGTVAISVVEGTYTDAKGGISDAERRTIDNLKNAGFVQ